MGENIISLGDFRAEIKKYRNFYLKTIHPFSQMLAEYSFSRASVCLNPSFISLGSKEDGVFINGIQSVYLISKSKDNVFFSIHCRDYTYFNEEVYVDYDLLCKL